MNQSITTMFIEQPLALTIKYMDLSFGLFLWYIDAYLADTSRWLHIMFCLLLILCTVTSGSLFLHHRQNKTKLFYYCGQRWNWLCISHSFPMVTTLLMTNNFKENVFKTVSHFFIQLKKNPIFDKRISVLRSSFITLIVPPPWFWKKWLFDFATDFWKIFRYLIFWQFWPFSNFWGLFYQFFFGGFYLTCLGILRFKKIVKSFQIIFFCLFCIFSLKVTKFILKFTEVTNEHQKWPKKIKKKTQKALANSVNLCIG